MMAQRINRLIEVAATPYIIAFALATSVSLVVTWRARQAQPRPGADWLAVTMGGVTWWSGMKFAETLVSESGRVVALFNALHWIGVGVVSVGVLGFGLSLTGRGEKITRRRIVLLSIIPTLTVSAWLGDPRVVYLLVTYANVPAFIVGMFETVEDAWPWFRWVGLTYLWGLIAIGSLFVLETALERPKLDPSRLLLGIMVAVPWSVNVLYEFGVIPYTDVDPTVLGFIVTGMAGIAVIDRFRLFDVPFARSRIVEQFSTPVLVYGNDHRLYDYNEQATSVLGITRDDLDTDVRQVLAETAIPISDQMRETSTNLTESLDGTHVSVSGNDSDSRHFLIQVSALDSGSGIEMGYTIQLVDVTRQRRQNKQIRRERNLKEMIRSVLVQLSSQDAIEQAFCDELIRDDRYRFVWIGGYAVDDELVVRTSASDGDGGVERRRNRRSPVEKIRKLCLEARETGTITVTSGPIPGNDATADSHVECEAAAAIPLRYNDITYGVIVLYSTRSDVFDPEERRVLMDMAESIAFAINAVEKRELLQGNQVREVSLRISDPDHYLVSLFNDLPFRDAETMLEVHEIGDEPNANPGSSADSGSGGHRLHFLTVRNLATESVVEALDAHPDVQSITILRDGDEMGSLRVLVDPPSLGSVMADIGGVIRTFQVTDEGVQVVAEFSPRVDMNQMIGRLRDVHPGTDIRSVVTKEPTAMRTDSSPLSSLTEKQRQALETAYRSGFFDRPQRQTADEVAETLDVSRSTFLKHLRRAENRLLERAVERDSFTEK